MSVKQIDESLELWNHRLGAAAQNLLDLQSHPVYKRISAPEAKLSGETAEQSELAVRTLSWLLQFFDLLQSTVSRAEELRRDMPAYFGAEEREREIAALLHGRSIQLPAAQIPFGKRSLVGAADNTNVISPAELLTTMESAFEEIKRIVLSLDAAWESLGLSMQRAAERAQRLQAERQQLEPRDYAGVESALERLENAASQASEDPLGSAAQTVLAIDELLHRMEAKLAELFKQRHQAQLDLAEARQLLLSAQKQHGLTKTKCEDAHEKTSYPFECEENERRLAGLRDWLNRLHTAAETTNPSAVLIGLGNWTAAARQLIAADQQSASKAEAQLAFRSELRGRLDALKAKARAHGLAELDELSGIAERAKRLLFTRPTPLAEASQAVAAYEALLNSKTAKSV